MEKCLYKTKIIKRAPSSIIQLIYRLQINTELRSRDYIEKDSSENKL